MLKYLVYCQVFWVKVRRLDADLYGRWCFITSLQISYSANKKLTRNVILQTTFSQTKFSSKIYPFS